MLIWLREGLQLHQIHRRAFYLYPGSPPVYLVHDFLLSGRNNHIQTAHPEPGLLTGECYVIQPAATVLI